MTVQTNGKAALTDPAYDKLFGGDAAAGIAALIRAAMSKRFSACLSPMEATGLATARTAMFLRTESAL